MSSSIRHALPAFVLLASMAGCGGGGNESGPAETIQLSDESVTIQSASPQCVVGDGPTVYVYGGQPPYKLFNSWPEAMTLDKTSLGDSGQGFKIHFNGYCMTDVAVTVEDDMGRLARLSVNSVPGG